MLQRAIRLDPNFAIAYAGLGTSYYNLGETSLAAQNARKERTARPCEREREKFSIESLYYQVVTGDLEKARQTHELWAQTYPRDYAPPNNLGVIYLNLGGLGENGSQRIKREPPKEKGRVQRPSSKTHD